MWRNDNTDDANDTLLHCFDTQMTWFKDISS